MLETFSRADEDGNGPLGAKCTRATCRCFVVLVELPAWKWIITITPVYHELCMENRQLKMGYPACWNFLRYLGRRRALGVLWDRGASV